MSKLSDTLTQAWYSNTRKWVWVLLPLSALFFLISRIRILIYKLGLKSAYRPSISVVVVGNISVGGNGKTPVVIALVEHLQSKGIRCAVLSRGYGGAQMDFPFMLPTAKESSASPLYENASVAKLSGDEPTLISQRTKVPVVIDPVRARGAKFIEEHTDAQVIVCDDGMQHYALARDIELCVMDGRGVGNGFLLPMGPLRETSARLSKVDYIVLNASQTTLLPVLKPYEDKLNLMRLAPQSYVNVQSGERLALEQAHALFAQAKSISAVAGIGDPNRFFAALKEQGLTLASCHPLPDHHQISKADMPATDIILMTEKDAVKCSEFANQKMWYLQVTAVIDGKCFDEIEKRLRKRLTT
ncbi:tetraacyldisaccharide 4'-kinase [Ningiella sp. W23]|uniref:tetraacyldisaccharide 4'-kinase n=1 Tax=Ningiella sp. W23 TaxID=3023715 RepID=UPI003756AFFF